jgi:hypothetical protein
MNVRFRHTPADRGLLFLSDQLSLELAKIRGYNSQVPEGVPCPEPKASGMTLLSSEFQRQPARGSHDVVGVMAILRQQPPGASFRFADYPPAIPYPGAS